MSKITEELDTSFQPLETKDYTEEMVREQEKYRERKYKCIFCSALMRLVTTDHPTDRCIVIEFHWCKQCGTLLEIEIPNHIGYKDSKRYIGKIWDIPYS